MVLSVHATGGRVVRWCERRRRLVPGGIEAMHGCLRRLVPAGTLDSVFDDDCCACTGSPVTSELSNSARISRFCFSATAGVGDGELPLLWWAKMVGTAPGLSRTDLMDSPSLRIRDMF